MNTFEKTNSKVRTFKSIFKMLHHLHVDCNYVDYNYQKLFFHLISVNFKKATSLERQRICRKTKNVITPERALV